MDLNKNSTIQQIREYYLLNPPEGCSKRTINSMSDADLLDMHSFLSEDEENSFDNTHTPDFFLEDLCENCQKKLKTMMRKANSNGR